MTPIEHYLITKLNMGKDSKTTREIINYLESKGYEVDFDRMSHSKGNVILLKNPTSKGHVWRENENCAIFEEEKILDPESYFYGSMAYEQTVISENFKIVEIRKNFYDPTDDAGIVHEVEYVYSKKTSKGFVTSLPELEKLDFRAINKLHDVLYENDLLLATANREISRETNKIMRKSQFNCKVKYKK